MRTEKYRDWKLGFLLATSLVVLIALVRAAVSRPATQKSVDDRVREYGEQADARLRPLFAAQGVAYPPGRVTFIALKEEKLLHLYAANKDGRWKLIKTYPVLAASGAAGPKLREGDNQVPEGLYRISLLNPNSRFHLSLRVNYPNEFDRKMAALDGRARLGGDIMIHGNAVSIGCLAIGDEGAEDLFVLAARTGLEHLNVIIAPLDLRRRKAPAKTENTPRWIDQLYGNICDEINNYP